MYGYDFCDKVIALVDQEAVNAAGEGGYYDGLLPTCFANDDLTRSFGDVLEDSLAGALHYMTNNQCRGLQRYLFQKQHEPILGHGFRGEIGAF